MDVRIFIVDAQIRNPLVTRIGGIAHRHFEIIFVKEHRHDLQRLVVFAFQRLIHALVHRLRRILIPTVNRRRALIGANAEADRIRVVGKAGKLRLQLRFFLEQKRYKSIHGAVHHQHDHVFPMLTQGDLGHILRRGLQIVLHLGKIRPDARHIHNGHADHRQTQRQIRCLYDRRFLLPDQIQQRHQHQQNRQVHQHLSGCDGRIDVVFEHGGEVAEVGSKEHIVHDGHTGQRQHDKPHGLFARRAGQLVEDPEPDQERTARQQQRIEHIPQRGFVRHDINEFRRRRLDDRRRNQNAGQDRKKHAAKRKNLSVRFRQRGSFALFCALLHQGQHQRELEHQKQEDEQDLLSHRIHGVHKQDHRKQRQSHNGSADAQYQPRVSELVEDILQQGENIVQRPVKHQSGRRIVQKHQKNQRHAVHLQLAFEREALHIDGGGDHIDGRHQDRQHIDGKPRYRKQRIRCAQIADRAERHAAQQLQAGKKAVGRNKKRDLQQQGDRPFQRIGRLIVILPVVSLQHHEAFVALERLFDVRHPRLQFRLYISLLGLQSVRPPVQGEHQKIHRQTQEDNRQARMIEDPVRD